MARVRKICSKLANHYHSLPGHFVGRDAVRLHKVGRHGSICGGGGVFGGRGKLHVDIHGADLQMLQKLVVCLAVRCLAIRFGRRHGRSIPEDACTKFSFGVTTLALTILVVEQAKE
jgi:hypothetical protein